MFDDDRLPTHLWVSAHIRQLNNDGIPAMVLQKGERNSDTLMLKLNMFENGCRVLTQMRDIDGARACGLHAVQVDGPHHLPEALAPWL